MSGKEVLMRLHEEENIVSVNALGVRERTTPRRPRKERNRNWTVPEIRERTTPRRPREERNSNLTVPEIRERTTPRRPREERNSNLTVPESEEENGSDTAEKENVTWIGQLKRGDAISFRRRIGPFKYKHHGIVEKIIPGTTRFRIIHVTGTAKDVVSSISSSVNTGICSEVIDFDKETDIFKYNFQRTRQDRHNPAAVAEMFLDYGLPKELGFNILLFNCESFSRYCATGIVYSKQSRQYNDDARIKLDEMVHINGRNYT